MAYKVIYAKRYLNNVAKLIAWLRNEWSDAAAAEVASSINKKISQISKNPEYHRYKTSPALLPY